MTWLSDFFHNMAINSSVPIFTALLLGLMASLGPCTMATNVAAIAYISRKLADRKFAILASLSYSLGRMVTYTLLGLLIIGIGLEVPVIRNFLEDVGTYVLGPILIVSGILMLVADRFSFGRGGPGEEESRTRSRTTTRTILATARREPRPLSTLVAAEGRDGSLLPVPQLEVEPCDAHAVVWSGRGTAWMWRPPGQNGDAPPGVESSHSAQSRKD